MPSWKKDMQTFWKGEQGQPAKLLQIFKKSMAYNYIVDFSTSAEIDLDAIFRYIALTLREPETASRQIGRLVNSILKFDHMPERFRIYEKEPWHSRGLRVMPVDNFLVMYMLDESQKRVLIACVIHGGRDVAAELSRTTD